MTTRRTVGPEFEIEYLLLPPRVYSALRREGYDKIRDLLRHTPESLREVRGVGVIGAGWIQGSLRLHGFMLRPSIGEIEQTKRGY